MALTAEQQAQVDFQIAIAQANNVNQKELETLRHQNQVVVDSKRAKLDLVRIAKEVLVENNRSKPVDSRDVTAADITAFATTLEAYVNS